MTPSIYSIYTSIYITIHINYIPRIAFNRIMLCYIYIYIHGKYAYRKQRHPQTARPTQMRCRRTAGGAQWASRLLTAGPIRRHTFRKQTKLDSLLHLTYNQNRERWFARADKLSRISERANKNIERTRARASPAQPKRNAFPPSVFCRATISSFPSTLAQHWSDTRSSSVCAALSRQTRFCMSIVVVIIRRSPLALCIKYSWYIFVLYFGCIYKAYKAYKVRAFHWIVMTYMLMRR